MASKILPPKPKPMDNIIITIPQRFIAYYGRRRFYRAMIAMSSPDSFAVWHHGLPSMPTKDTLYCYLVLDGWVRFRLNVAGFGNGPRLFDDTTNKICRDGGHGPYVELCGPLVKAPLQIAMKGFQGYRYSPALF